MLCSLLQREYLLITTYQEVKNFDMIKIHVAMTKMSGLIGLLVCQSNILKKLMNKTPNHMIVYILPTVVLL